MKIFNLYKSIGVLALAITLLTSCSNDQYWSDPVTETLPALTSGSADFSNYVALGASFSSGDSDNALFIASQMNSFPNTLAGAFSNIGGGEFTQPMMNDNIGGLLLNGEVYYGPRLYFNGAGPVSLDATPTTEISNILTGPFNNMGVSGIKSYQFQKQGFGNITGLGSGANPYFVRMASSPSATVLEDAVSQSPTFFTISVMGGNDVLSYSTSGGAFGIDQIGNQDTSTYSPYDITDPTAFNNAITGVVSALTANGAKGVLSNVPYVTDLPFFTTVPFDALAPGLVDQPTIELLNAQLYGLLNGIFTAYGEPNRVNLLSLTDANPVLIQDNDATDFSAQITGYLLTLGFPAETAGAYGAIFGQARQTTENDLILLSASGAIGAPVLGAPEPLNIAGISNPLANQYVLTDIETQKSNNATDAFSQIVQNLATEYGLAFVDLKLVLAEAATTGIMFDEFNLNADFITGGLVSVNGIHLTARGYALMANEFLEQIDATYGSNFGASGSMVKAGNFVVFYPEGL